MPLILQAKFFREVSRRWPVPGRQRKLCCLHATIYEDSRVFFCEILSALLNTKSSYQHAAVTHTLKDVDKACKDSHKI